MAPVHERAPILGERKRHLGKERTDHKVRYYQQFAVEMAMVDYQPMPRSVEISPQGGARLQTTYVGLVAVVTGAVLEIAAVLSIRQPKQ